MCPGIICTPPPEFSVLFPTIPKCRSLQIRRDGCRAKYLTEIVLRGLWHQDQLEIEYNWMSYAGAQSLVEGGIMVLMFITEHVKTDFWQKSLTLRRHDDILLSRDILLEQ